MKTILFVFIAVIGFVLINVANSTHLTTEIATVQDLQQQQIIGGSKDNISTEIRYLVITDKGTFICESSLLNGKFNNSDLFWHLKKDSTYRFELAGFGKSFLYDYKNILDAKQFHN